MAGDAPIIVPWLVVNLTGQCCVLVLLVTFAMVKHLPQRRNPFLVNLILTTFLGTIPPALRLYAGQQFENKINNLCYAQAALVQGIAPMFGSAQLVLVFDTWCELRSLCFHKRHISRGAVVKYLLIFAPYVVMWVWTFAAFIAGTASNSDEYTGYVYCQMTSGPASSVRTYVGVFMAILGIIEIFLELWVGWLIYSYPAKVQEDPTAWRTSAQFALRVLIFSSLQVIALIVSFVNNAFHNDNIKYTYEILDAMNALATFVAFGTQKNILRSWKFWGKTKQVDDPDEPQPQGYPMLDWAEVPFHHPTRFDGDAFDGGEKTQTVGYQKTWLSLKNWYNVV